MAHFCAAATGPPGRLAWGIFAPPLTPANVAVVALANKMARTIWASLAHDRIYQERFVGRPV